MILKKNGLLKRGALGGILKRAAVMTRPSAASVLFLLIISKIMSGTGQTLVIAQGITEAVGDKYAFVAGFIGLIGSFITGSNMSSNILFTDVQNGAAASLGNRSGTSFGRSDFGSCRRKRHISQQDSSGLCIGGRARKRRRGAEGSASSYDSYSVNDRRHMPSSNMRKRGEDMKTIFKNGRIHTMNGGEIVDSISVEDGRIVSDDYVPEDGRIREVDLCKKTVIPAFHDSHQHFLCYATDKEKINFFDAKSLADMEYLTKKYMKEKDIKKGQWIQGGGWNENNFDDPILPTRRDLDKFCPDNPAIFTRACCSVAVANTLALKEAGIFENPPEMDDGSDSHR